MATTRYSNTDTAQLRDEPEHYLTFDVPAHLKGLPAMDVIGTTASERYVYVHGDRLDKLAARYYGDDQYWWVIAMANGIAYPLGITPGTELLIPLDLSAVLKTLRVL